VKLRMSPSRHTSVPWSLNAVACGQMLIVAIFPHRTSRGGSCNEDRRAIYFSRLTQGKLLILIIRFIDNRSKNGHF